MGEMETKLEEEADIVRQRRGSLCRKRKVEKDIRGRLTCRSSELHRKKLFQSSATCK